MTRNIQLYGSLLLLTVVSWWLSQHSGSDDIIVSDAPPNSPDYFSTNYSKIEMDTQGMPLNKVVADKVTHFSDDDTTELINPVMTLFKGDAPPWIIRSETGIVPAGGRDLFLNGKVFIDREKAPGYKRIKVITSNLRVKPEQNYAETDEWTELIMPPNRTTGTGMEANFSEPLRIKLLSGVRGRYER